MGNLINQVDLIIDALKRCPDKGASFVDQMDPHVTDVKINQSQMRLYLDTADCSAWDSLMPLGIFYGITTNPLLAERAGLAYDGINWQDMAQHARSLGAQELHAQVVDVTDDYMRWAEALYAAGQKAGIDCVVKVPLTIDGIRAASEIKTLGGKVLMTACYHSKQMFTATALGADYIAPYFGRMHEAGLDAMAHMAQMRAIGAGSHTRILIASLRSVDQMVDLAMQGHDCFTLAPAIAAELVYETQTDEAAADFERAAKG